MLLKYFLWIFERNILVCVGWPCLCCPVLALATARARTQLAGSEASWATVWPPAASSVPAVSSSLLGPQLETLSCEGRGVLLLALQDQHSKRLRWWDGGLRSEQFSDPGKMSGGSGGLLTPGRPQRQTYRRANTSINLTGQTVKQSNRTTSYWVTSNEQNCSHFFSIFFISDQV